MSSFPVPVSPSIRTAKGERATVPTASMTFWICGLVPIRSVREPLKPNARQLSSEKGLTRSSALLIRLG